MENTTTQTVQKSTKTSKASPKNIIPERLSMEEYFVMEMQEVKAENRQLQNTINEMMVKAGMADSDPNKVVSLPKLGITYDISTYSWYIKPNNVAEYRKALADRNFDWLNKHEYQIIGCDWNHEIHLGSECVRLHLYYTSGHLDASVINLKYGSRQAAEEALLLTLKEDLAEYDEKHANDSEES